VSIGGFKCIPPIKEIKKNNLLFIFWNSKVWRSLISKNIKKELSNGFFSYIIFFCVCELWPLKLITAIAAAARECVYCTHTGGENITRNVTIVTKRWSRRFFWKEEKRRKNFVLFSVLCVCCIAFWMCNKNFLFFCCCDPPLLSIWRIGYERDTVGVFLNL
jgi:hypothetical protein